MSERPDVRQRLAASADKPAGRRAWLNPVNHTFERFRNLMAYGSHNLIVG